MEMEQVKKVVQINENENPLGNDEQVDDGAGGEKRDNELSYRDKLTLEVVQVNENENAEQKEEQVEAVSDDGDDNEFSYMDELPSEILMKILDYLDEKQLVKCRLLSTRWNEICCLLLQDKIKNSPDSKLIVQLENISCTTVITKPLVDFLACFAPTEGDKSSEPHCRHPFPFSDFRIKILQSMDVTQVCEFVSTFGPHMKTVFLDIKSEDIAHFENLWGHLLDFAPNIQFLGVEGDSSLENVISFDSATKSGPKDTFLKNLKVVGIIPRNFGLFGFVKDLLNNAPKVEKVVSYGDNTNGKLYEWKGLEIWQQLGKAHLLKKLEITYFTRHDVLSAVDLMKNLRLEHLAAHCFVFSDTMDSQKEVAACWVRFGYIHHALKSSQETFTSLFLAYLTEESMNRCFKGIKSLPNVRQLYIIIMGTNENRIVLEGFSQLCPNITNLNLDCLLGDFSQVVPILWTGFKGLKSLSFQLDMPSNNNNDSFISNLDSGISGYSTESIERIQTKLQHGISLEEAREGETQNLSILNLTDLSRLEIEFYMRKRTDEMEQKENELRKCFFMNILPQHIRENPRSITYRYD